MLTKDDIDGLRDFLAKAEQFSLDAFDWISPLRMSALYKELLQARADVVLEIMRLQKESEEEDA